MPGRTLPYDALLTIPPKRPIIGARAWRGADLARTPNAWTWHLSEADIEALEDATMAYQASGRPLEEITADTFPLPKLAKKIAAIRAEITQGRGFHLVKGLPVERYKRSALGIMFLGLGAHVGNHRPQNDAGHLLGHVRDLG
ncbi:MAG: TauD/TfdA family dioxygenase, partial [Shimia sp.]